MGNRAIIKLKNDKKPRSVYVQWNGGEGSAAAFVDEAKKRMATRNSTDGMLDITGEDKDEDERLITTFYATLFVLIREYFGYCSDYKEKAPLSVYMDTGGSDGEDNGCYWIENDFSCERFNHDEFEEHEQNNFESITLFFNGVHAALSTVIAEEKSMYYDKPTLDSYKADILHARKIAASAVDRLARLEAKIEELEALEASERLETAG